MSPGLRLNLHVQVLYLKHTFLCSSAIMLVLEEQICVNTVDILGDNLSKTHVIFGYV